MSRRILCDFETRAELSVIDLGAWKYAFQPSNEILCVSWTVRDPGAAWGPVFVAVNVGGSDGRAAVERRVREKGRHIIASMADFRRDMATAPIRVAHNSGFEDAHLWRHFPELQQIPHVWSCTASRARRLALPGNLEGACNVMQTPHRKSIEGHRTMLMVSQPRPTWRKNPSGPKWYDDADRLADNAVYCGDDIYAERDLDDVLPELPPQEYECWRQIERGNQRGLLLDRELIDAMGELVNGYASQVIEEIRYLTGDPEFSLNQIEKVRDFCARYGTHLVDLTAGTVENVIAGARSGKKQVHPLVVKVLEARQSVGKSSNAKVPAMLDRIEADHYARDYAIYHGAHTGRPTGSKVNPLNFPRPYRGYDQKYTIALLKARDIAALERLTTKDSAGRETPVAITTSVSSSLRGTIIAPSGKKFVIGDYSSIEPCVSFTVAGQWDAVEVLRRRESLYIEFGKTVYGRVLDKKKDLADYTAMKVSILQLGYGSGVTLFLQKLQENLSRVGVDVTEGQATAWRDAYHSRFPQIKASWKGLEAAAKAAIQNPGFRASYGVINFVFDGWWLVATLPSGRQLFYPNARLEPGKYQDEIIYEGRLKGGAWGNVRTWGGTLCENAAQSIARDVTTEDKLALQNHYGWHIPLDVYDEIVAEADKHDTQALDKLHGVMRRSRVWLPEMPVWAEGFETNRYVKED